MLKGRGFDSQRQRFIRITSASEGSILQYPRDVTNGYYMMYSIYPHAGGITLSDDKKTLVADSSETEPVANIALYMPGELGSEAEIEWDSGKSFVKKLGGTESIVDTINKGLGQQGDAEQVKAFKSMSNMFLKGVVDKGAGMVRESDAFNDLERLTGQIANSHSEQFFSGVGYRSFSFNYKFQPTSHEETNVVRDIIRQFRRNALPELSESKLTSFYPSTFEIEFITPHIASIENSSRNTRNYKKTRVEGQTFRNPYMPRLKPLVCTGCNVTYGSGGGSFSSFKDGSPVEIDLELSFTETSKVYMKDVDEGY